MLSGGFTRITNHLVAQPMILRMNEENFLLDRYSDAIIM
jgi:hypothetical protein